MFKNISKINLKEIIDCKKLFFMQNCKILFEFIKHTHIIFIYFKQFSALIGLNFY